MNTTDRTFEDDDLPALPARLWTAEKYDLLYYYADIFATSMKEKWPERVYIDLFAGPGMSRINGQERLVRGSTLLALDVRYPFDKYIFCETREDYIEALKRRVERLHPGANVAYIPGAVEDNVERVLKEIPPHSNRHGVISFCFVDPFDLAPSFQTIKAIGSRKVDFMHLLALGMDARRNFFVSYVRNQRNKIDRFLGRSDWRDDWLKAELAGDRKVIRFLAQEHANSMEAIGYEVPALESLKPVRSGAGLSLYHLALYSENPLAYEFWEKSKKGTREQTSLFDT